MHQAARAYSAIAKQTARPRDLEADLLLDAAARLQAVREAFEEKHAQLGPALQNNRMLWSILVAAAASPDNPLPKPVRQNVANLGIYVFNETIAILAAPRPGPLGTLISINRELAAGLRDR